MANRAKPLQNDIAQRLGRFRLEKSYHKARRIRPLASKSSNHSTGALESDVASILWSEGQSQPNHSLRDALSTYRRDHFTTLPVHDDDSVQSLFAFYLNDLNNKTAAQNPNRDFIPIALGSAACFHVLMATVLQVQRLQGRPGGDCFWYHRGGAIAALNKDLSDSKPQVTDAMFCAVGMLAYIESRVPDLRTHSASMHIAALDRFLEMRHGMLSVELYGMLLRLSLWCDINPPLTVPPVSNPKASVDATSNVKLPIRYSDPTPSPSDVFDDICRLVALREEYGCDPLPHGRDRERSLAYHELVSHRLHRTARSLPHSLLFSTAETIVLRCIRLGQILFMYTVSPAISVSGVYSRSIADALRLCLEQTNPENGDSVYWSPEVLCWLLFNGAITNQAKVTQEWYFSRLREFLHSQSISHFDQVEALLRKVCWLEDQFGVACRTLYRDLVLAVNG